MKAITRRDFLKTVALGGAACLVNPWRAGAQSDWRGSTVDWARLQFNGINGDTDNWNVHPQGDLNLINQINDRTTIRIRNNWNIADIGKLREMTAFPFLFMTAELPPNLTAAHRANLREYMLRGGFLYAEDCVIGKDKKVGTNLPKDAFFLKMVQELPKIVPEARLVRLPNDHPIFHCFYDLPAGLPDMQGIPHGLHGLIHNGRLLAALSPSDNHCGWVRCFSEEKNTAALQMGTNLYVYAITQFA